MEAATTPGAARPLTGDKAARIVEAMRESVARRGSAGSTFDHVAREAGVSRGLLHYYFATKERLLVEVVRRDCDLRMEMLDRHLAGARSADDFIDLLVVSLEEMVRDDPAFVSLIFEMFTLSRRNEDLATEFGELLRRQRERVAQLLREKDSEGVLHLRADPEAIVDILFAIGDGLAMRMLAEPDRDYRPTVQAGVRSVRALLDDRV